MASQRRIDKIVSVVSQRQAGLVVVIEDVHDPHNAEAIFRTCDAFGVQHVYLIFEREPAWNPQKIGKQSSSSAHKWLTFHIFRSTRECLQHLKGEGYTLMATTLADPARSLFKTRCGVAPLALLVGNEHSGLSSEALSLADLKVKLPMRGMVESLNVSVATALFLYEITRQRINKDLALPPSERTALIDEFSLRSRHR